MIEADPFAPQVPQTAALVKPGTPEEARPLAIPGTFQMVDARGIVGLYKLESGIPVKIRVLGPLKQQVKLAIFNAALAPAIEKSPAELAGMSHMELAAYHFAKAASDGNGDAIDRLWDRLIGKPKQSTESVRVNYNIDEALESEDTPKDISPLREFEETESTEL